MTRSFFSRLTPSVHFSRISRRGLVQALCLATACSSPFAAHAADGANPRVKLSTTAGDIVLQLDAEKAPKTVANFLQYVRAKHYDGTIFHRVIDGFMIQGGGFTPDMQQRAVQAPLAMETTGLKNDIYTVAMARTSNPNSATAQFFINVKDNAMLNPPGSDGYGYAVFGKVVSGKEVVDKMRGVATGNKGQFQNVPVTPIVIESATVLP